MKDDRRQERRQAIVAAAREVFMRHGYSKTTLMDVARKALVGKATLYNYFDGKEDLLRAVVEDFFGQYLNTQKKAIGQASTAQDALERYAQTFLLEHRRMSGSIDRAALNDGELPLRIHPHIRKLSESELVLVQNILQEGIARKEFRDMPLRRVALLFLGGLRAMIFESRISREGEIPDICRDFVETLFHGISSREDTAKVAQEDGQAETEEADQ